MTLENRVVVITGATGHLGPFAARSFAEMGAKLVLAATHADKLEALEKTLALPAEQLRAIAVPLAQPDSAQKVLDAAVSRFGRADILLHLAGGHIGGKPVAQVEDDEVLLMLQQHFWTTFYMARVMVPHMLANVWGRLIVITSPSAGAPPANSLPYAVGKTAEEALMLTLAEELRGTGVTANILRVRIIDTKHERDLHPTASNRSWTTPEEICATLLHLCSDEAGTINGARIPLYGNP